MRCVDCGDVMVGGQPCRCRAPKGWLTTDAETLDVLLGWFRTGVRCRYSMGRRKPRRVRARRQAA
jgi:hypothetical protein